MQSVNEGFADRKYQQLTQLRSRQLEGAVLHDSKEVLEQVGGFIDQKVQLSDCCVIRMALWTPHTLFSQFKVSNTFSNSPKP